MKVTTRERRPKGTDCTKERNTEEEREMEHPRSTCRRVENRRTGKARRRRQALMSGSPRRSAKENQRATAGPDLQETASERTTTSPRLRGNLRTPDVEIISGPGCMILARTTATVFRSSGGFGPSSAKTRRCDGVDPRAAIWQRRRSRGPDRSRARGMWRVCHRFAAWGGVGS